MVTRIIAVANQKGGVGKTTTIINLAASLADLGKMVLVVDLDPQANATSGLGLQKQDGSSFYEALIGIGSIHDHVYQTVFERVHVIPSELDLAGSEVELARQDEYLHCCRKALRPAVEDGRYEFILIDCPPSLGILTMNALTAAHSVVVPMQCEYYALEGLSVITHLIEKLRAGANPDLVIEGILMTMYDGRTNLSKQVVDEVRKHFPALVYETLIPRNVRISEAPSHGEPVIYYDEASPGARAYRQFGAEFLKRVEARGASPTTGSSALPS